ncbi:hypothetical protein ACQ4M3_26830 [Leptolyngbya sp. AN03gr2]|uniref:hypothetical protein n=1 Tax=unclassified Leptolyngbya TaxID=2650499 RepID=UPI003D316057
MKRFIISGITSLGLLFSASTAIAQSSHETKQTEPFQRIEQPFANKAIVTIGGLGLIGLELWWFLHSKSKSHSD